MDGYPQIEDGFTRISNELLEAFYRIKLRDEERRVWLMIARKTYGWNKKEAHISLSYFSTSIGILRPHIVRGIKQLMKLNMIHSTTSRTSNIKLYSINKHYLTWSVVPPAVLHHKNEEAVPPVVIIGTTSGTSGSTKTHINVVPPVVPIKEIIKEKEKESIKERENFSLSPFSGENQENQENGKNQENQADEMDEETDALINQSKRKIKANGAKLRLSWH